MNASRWLLILTHGLKASAKVGERGQVVIPKAILTLRPTINLQKVRSALQRYKGSQAGKLQADGFGSVDESLRITRSR